MPHFFRPAPGKRFSRFDMLVYRLFFRCWTRHLETYPDLRELLLTRLGQYHGNKRRRLGQLELVSSTLPSAAKEGSQ